MIFTLIRFFLYALKVRINSHLFVDCILVNYTECIEFNCTIYITINITFY